MSRPIAFCGALIVCSFFLLCSPTAAVATSGQAAGPLASDRIKHIVVLMLENRAFDHLFGWYPGVDGLNNTNTQYFNRVNASNPSSPKVFQTPNATYINQCDPNHGFPATTYKIFGPQAAWHNNLTVATMSGFVDFENTWDHQGLSNNYCNVMESFTPDRLPIINTLASEYVLFDRFFAAMPGPTWPNRMFFMAGTSSGLTETFPWYHDTVGTLFPTKTIFDQVTEAGAKWRIYYNDTPWELFMESIAHHTEHVHSLGQFFDDCREGTLPDFAYINPRSGINVTTGLGSNDEHPDHDMACGEQYLKDIYEAIRASPQWNETLFVLTYDEHGGFYDHVPPPMTDIPGPGDGEASYPDLGFTFDRLGIRIPTILISPWVPKGLIVHDAPDNQKPFPNSEYDLTSIIASSRKILNVLNGTPALTKRDAWSATFEHTLEMLPEMRTDCLEHLPAPPTPTLPPNDEAELPVNSLQDHIMTVHSGLVGRKYPYHVQKQADVAPFLQHAFRHHHRRTQDWKRSKIHARMTRRGAENEDHTPLLHLTRSLVESGAVLAANVTPRVILQPVFNSSFASAIWHLNNVTNHTGLKTISTKLKFPGTSTEVDYCLDSGLGSTGAHITVTQCYPSTTLNRDHNQQWWIEEDATYRPRVNPNLCMMNSYFTESDDRLFLSPCVVGVVEQHWAYHGAAPGQPFQGNLFFGDWATGVKVQFVPSS